MLKVENMISSRGNTVANQFIIYANDGKYFQSYDSIIAFIPNGNYKPELIGDYRAKLDEKYWNYSTTTGKYRNLFLGEDRKETEKQIKRGNYILTNLNA